MPPPRKNLAVIFPHLVGKRNSALTPEFPMLYEDPSGCIWTEEEDGEGYVYYVNNKTLETAWELPPSTRVVTSPQANDVPQHSSASWTEIFDEATNSTYFFNTSTQESTWDLGAEDRLASGISMLPDGNEYALGEFRGSSRDPEGGAYASASRRNEVLKDFQVPREVSEVVGRAASAYIWPPGLDGRPSRLERWNVLKAADPYRELFSTGEGWRQEHPEFEPKLYFYAFDRAVEHVKRYWVEEAEAPFRCRLQRDALKFSRDIAKWEPRAPVQKNGSGKVEQKPKREGVAGEGERRWSGGSGGGSSSDSGGGGGGGAAEGDGAGFFAFPVVVHNSHAHHVDWTSGPDRYQITRGAEPEWGWTRLFTFFAYAASKYHVLETADAPLAQKIVKGNFLTPEPGWKCLLAFFAFDDDIPGSSRYYIEEKDEPHLRSRVGMEPSSRWEARHTFAAFDVPVPGSGAFDVHYTIRSTDSLNAYPEQCRISLKDPWGCWEQKFRFYAFPAEAVLLSPDPEGSEKQDGSYGS